MAINLTLNDFREATGSDMVTTVNYHTSGSLRYTVRHETLQDKSSKSVPAPDQPSGTPRV